MDAAKTSSSAAALPPKIRAILAIANATHHIAPSFPRKPRVLYASAEAGGVAGGDGFCELFDEHVQAGVLLDELACGLAHALPALRIGQ